MKGRELGVLTDSESSIVARAFILDEREGIRVLGRSECNRQDCFDC